MMKEDIGRYWKLTTLISSPSYENFLEFRKLFLVPIMNLPFVEEDYDKELWEELFDNWQCVHEISRGHGKSEYGIQLIIYLSLAQPHNPRYEEILGQPHRMNEFLIISADNTTVSELRDRILGYLLADDLLRQYIPEGTIKKDLAARYNTQKINLTNGTAMHFRPIKTKRGLHVDFCWIDDPTTESSTLTDRQTDDFVKGAIFPMTTAKQAVIWVTGTPLRNTDILNVLAKTGTFFHKKRPALKEDGNPLSKRFTARMLDEIRKTIGSIKFSSEYMLNPVDDSVSLIKKSWIDQCRDNNLSFVKHRAHYDTVVIGVDFAFGDTEYTRGGGDYFVAAVMGMIGNKKYLLNVYRRNDISATEQLSYIKELNAIYHFDTVALEFNSIRALASNLKDLNLPLKLYNTSTVDEKDKKNPDFSRVISLSKRNMILRQGTQLENELVVLPYKDEYAQSVIDLYTEEATSWALEEDKIIELGRHPDVPIAIGLALECLNESAFIIEW